VVKDDEEDGDRPKALYVGPKAPVVRCGPRLVTGNEKSLVKP
jgi:hypothetical protein